MPSNMHSKIPPNAFFLSYVKIGYICLNDPCSSYLYPFSLVRFDPPGPMSAGLTCEFIAVLKPMVGHCLLLV